MPSGDYGRLPTGGGEGNYSTMEMKPNEYAELALKNDQYSPMVMKADESSVARRDAAATNYKPMPVSNGGTSYVSGTELVVDRQQVGTHYIELRTIER